MFEDRILISPYRGGVGSCPVPLGRAVTSWGGPPEWHAYTDESTERHGRPGAESRVLKPKKNMRVGLVRYSRTVRPEKVVNSWLTRLTADCRPPDLIL